MKSHKAYIQGGVLRLQYFYNKSKIVNFYWF